MDDARLLALMALLTVTSCGWMLWQLYYWSILPNPSSKGVRSALIAALTQLPVGKECPVCECGAGIGLLVADLHAAGFRNSFGVEGSWIVWSSSRLLALWWRLPKVHLKWGWWQEHYQAAQLLIFYLSQQAMREAARELRGARRSYWVVSHTFMLPGFEPYKVYWYQGLYRVPIYIYYIQPATPHARPGAAPG